MAVASVFVMLADTSLPAMAAEMVTLLLNVPVVAERAAGVVAPITVLLMPVLVRVITGVVKVEPPAVVEGVNSILPAVTCACCPISQFVAELLPSMRITGEPLDAAFPRFRMELTLVRVAIVAAVSVVTVAAAGVVAPRVPFIPCEKLLTPRIVFVPLACPMFSAVDAPPAKLTVVAVALTSENVVLFVVAEVVN